MQQHLVAHTRRPAAMAVGLAALILNLAACSSAGSSSEAPASEAAASEAAASEAPASLPAASEAGGTATTVIMSGLAFEVAEITVPVGDVTFVNEDSTPHLIAEGENGTEVADPRVQKVSINGGAEGELTFAEAGDYHITCLIHPQMNMVVHVE
jgi:plastocyanin